MEGRRERFQFLQQARVSDRYTLAMREKVRRELRHILPHSPKAQGTLTLGGKPGLSRARLSYSEHWPFRFHCQNCRTHTDNDIPQKLLPEQLTTDVFFFNGYGSGIEKNKCGKLGPHFERIWVPLLRSMSTENITRVHMGDYTVQGVSKATYVQLSLGPQNSPW